MLPEFKRQAAERDRANKDISARGRDAKTGRMAAPPPPRGGKGRHEGEATTEVAKALHIGKSGARSRPTYSVVCLDARAHEPHTPANNDVFAQLVEQLTRAG